MHQKQVKVISRLVSIILVIIFLIKSNQLEIVVLKFNLFLKNQSFIIVLSYSMVNLYLVKRYRIYHKKKRYLICRNISTVINFVAQRYTNIKVGEAKRKKKNEAKVDIYVVVLSSASTLLSESEWIANRNNSILN